VFEDTMKEMNIPLDPQIFPAGTDGRFMRNKGYPVIGFSPINNQPVLLHDHDERLNKNVFTKGIQIYEKLLVNLANMQDD
jgi:aminoacylase